MANSEPVSELDLLAYADGMLDHDPERKQKVEAYLRATPNAAERVNAYQAQSQALRDTYGPRATQPVPDHLHHTLHATARGRTYVTGLRAAAMLAVSVAAGLAGWYLGQLSGPEPKIASDRVPSILREIVRQRVDEHRTKTVSASAKQSNSLLHWEEDGVDLRLAVPELLSLGYELTGRRLMSHRETQAVALTYRGDDGATLHLVIAPLFTEKSRLVAESRDSSEAIAHWSQGPLRIAAQVEGDGRNITSLARDIRETIAHQPTVPRHQLPLEEFRVPPGKSEVTADALSQPTPDRAKRPVTHTTIGQDTVFD